MLANLLGYLDELLTPASFSDYGPNGLQVPGPQQIETVVTGVSAGDPDGAAARVFAQKPPGGIRVPVGACIGFRTRT